MKRGLCLILAMLMCLALISCGEKKGEEGISDVPEYADKARDLPTIRDPDGTSTMPADKSVILLNQTEKHTNLTVDEKLEILNGLKNREIVSAFLVVHVMGVWRSVELSADSQPEAFNTVVEYFAEPDNGYELFEWDLSELTEYDAYVILTDAKGEQYTIFVQDYCIIHYDEQIGTFSNGNPEYAHTEAAAVCFDGDWFVIRDTLVWWTLTHIDVDFTGYYD